MSYIDIELTLCMYKWPRVARPKIFQLFSPFSDFQAHFYGWSRPRQPSAFFYVHFYRPSPFVIAYNNWSVYL